MCAGRTSLFVCARAAHPYVYVRGPHIFICLCASRTSLCVCARAAHPYLSLRSRAPIFVCARQRDSLILSHNCTVSLTFSFIAGSSRFPSSSQEIDQPLSQPVPTPPSAQVPPRQQQTPPGADVATQRSVATPLTQDPDVPMSSLTAYRASPPRLEDVASSQDILDPDADGDDDPSTASRVPPPRVGSALDGSSFPLLGFSPPCAPLHLAHTISFPPPLTPTLTDSMDYDQFNTPIHAGPFSFYFYFRLFLILFPYHPPLEDLPPKMPGDVVRPENLLADDADRCASHSSFLLHRHSSPYPTLSF